MYRVTVHGGFSASHRLRLANGEYEPLHGHDWSVEVTFAGPELDAEGMLVDFCEVKDTLAKVCARLHHCDLNECPDMQGVNPSAEHVARIVFEMMAETTGRPELLESVRVEEEPGCFAAFFAPLTGRVSSNHPFVDDEIGGS